MPVRKKRALLARVLLRKPSLLLLDEPMNHLDENGKRQVLESVRLYLEGSTASEPRGAVMVSHGELDLSRFQPGMLQRVRLSGPAAGDANRDLSVETDEIPENDSESFDE